jgi:outer membrane protein OmpA-like peptidoglycan-associated protein
MESTTMVIRNVQRALGVSALTLALAACAHGPSDQLVDARRAYDDAKDSPARTRRPNELEAARVALQRAEEAHDDSPRSQREKRLAQEAEHKARLAEAHGEEAEAQREANQAEREAAQAHARADAAEDAHAREHAREQQAREEAAEARAESHAEARQERTERTRASGDERPAARGTRKSSAALQNLAPIADVREEPRGVVITLSGSLLFPSGDQKLSPIAQRNLDRVAQALAEQPKDAKFRIEGHTDNSGDARQNKQLSAQRAKAVAEQLEQSGIDRDRIEVEDYGESRPIAGNDTPEGRAANRRVEIVIERPVKTAQR